ncbi:MAG: ribonuclease P protein component [Chitinophagales bacterium]|nr:ribonuclease P protein component [Chitinophagales bacterium]MDW8428055.1 ribonuclease P protein component [Chitinophagales bacterium]
MGEDAAARRYSLPREERLRRKRLIRLLFERGAPVRVASLRLLYHRVPEALPAPVQVLFSVSSRSIRLAVRRNRIRRLMREAYRKNKYILLDSISPGTGGLLLAIQYFGNTLPAYRDVEKNLVACMQKIAERLCTS